ncbi:Actin cytoskeleton-regulatory complex protein SLA1 [Rhodotorula toruloides]|uniref:Actin cytoskeleton-regulatory complex protein SLA1 n=1 Tax=Rhodotorula toruloides TaxID=5286 RepID=A0A0K3C6B2_RHOTO|nr:Actin cytoskeleton-regulatory complex protein SLA1 [Rhodotorula toruloides]PRQ76770.1 hypothetical protein AAT19DRAFT_12188 [Rhodotorula toruloides]
MAQPTYAGLARVEFEYEAQTEDELTVQEDQVVWVIEDDDDDWHKVKLKVSDPSTASPAGLVPASYLAPVPALRTTTALYDYAPARDESTGELENDEEMEIAEGEELEVLEEESEWVLCRKTGGTKGVGYVPATYIDGGAGAEEAAAAVDAPEEEAHEDYSQVQDEHEEEEEHSYAGPAATAAAVGAAAGVGAVAASHTASEIKTWSVTMLDAKKKKKKGTLGVGNGALFFASESDKTPVQQYPLSSLADITSEKSKHLHLSFPSAPDGEPLHFVIGDKPTFDDIVAKIESDRGAPATNGASSSIPPPPPLPGTNGSTAPPPPPPPPPPPGPAAASSYVPPPPPIRSTPSSSSALPPPPIRSAATPSPAPPAPPAPAAQKGNALALYDFESQGDDELSLAEGERVEYIPGGSDDAEWAKVRRVDGSGEEGVVPASYIEIDEGIDMNASAPPPVPAAPAMLSPVTAAPPVPTPPPPPPAPPAPAANVLRPPPIRSVAAANAESRRSVPQDEEDAEDEAALRAQLEADAKAQRDRERRAEKERRAERERRDRMKSQPRASPIPVPNTRDEVDSDSGAAPPPLASRPPKEKKREVRKPNAAKTRIWKDRTGQFKVEAEFLGLNANKIRLHKVNGVIIEVPVEKMSLEDVAYIKQVQSGGSSSRRDREREREGSSDRRERDRDRDGRSRSSRTDAVKSVVTVSKPRRSEFDWFDFFLQAGCDVDHCTRYARNAENEGIDETLIPDFEESNLRGLGMKEGDVIRVKRFIKEKYAKPPPTPDKDAPSSSLSPAAASSASDRDAQIAADHALAQKLARGEPIPPAPQLFSSGPEGTLKPRRGRRNTAASNTSVNSGALTAAASELEKNRTTSPATTPSASTQRPTSPVESRKRSSSTVPVHGGFDDDAWEVKPSSKPAASAPSPAPAAPSPPPAPTPPPAPPAPAPATSPAPAPAKPAEPARTDSNAGLTYNDGLLAQLGIGANGTSSRPSSTPAQVAQPTGSSSSFITPQATGFNPNAPRGPIAPVPANQGLLAPLQPMRTGMPAAQALQAQNTGFFPGATTIGVMPMSTGFSAMPMMSQPTGFSSMTAPMSMQPTGFVPQATGFASQPTGFASQPTGFSSQPTGFMQSQPTGFMQQPSNGFMQPQPTGFGGGGSVFNQPQQQQQPQQPIQFNPMPPSSSSQSPANTVASIGATHNAPTNVFASMKDGTFAKGSTHLPPQDSTRYDALRPGMLQAQPTGFMQQPQQQMGMGMGMGGMMPQMTGFMPQQQPQYGYQPY